MLVPPQGEALQDRAEDLPRHLHRLGLGRPRDALRSGLAREEGQGQGTAARLDVAVARGHLGIAGGVGEEQPRGIRVRLQVGEPRVERARHALLERVVAGQVLAPHLAQGGVMALEQLHVEVLLGGEVVVDDRGRDARSSRDLVHRRAAIAALGEDLGGRALDELAALLF